LKNRFTYYGLAAILLMLACVSCRKYVNKRVTFWRNDKIPYGTYYAFENLSHLFKNAYIETSGESPANFYDGDETTSAYIIIGVSMQPSEKELRSILNHAIEGNHVFISALQLGENLLDTFGLEYTELPGFVMRNDSLTIRFAGDWGKDHLWYTYPGYSLANHFTRMDSSVTRIIGKDRQGNANFIKFSYEGGGAIYLHLAPAAFTNFFLLHKDNKSYYDQALSVIPDTVSYVRWDDYYRHHINGRNNSERSAFSKLSAFLENEVLRWAFWLAVLLFAIMYLIESKRKQRAIPTVKKLSNTSLDFVKTVGRLYYQRKDNKNLAQKIAANFLGHLRSRYNLHTSQLDAAFEERLAYKTGSPAAEVKEVIGQIRAIDSMYSMSDDELLAFTEKIDTFINKP